MRNEEERLLTVKEVATWLRMSPAWVHAHSDGKRRPNLPCIKFGRIRRFREADINKFIEECHSRVKVA